MTMRRREAATGRQRLYLLFLLQWGNDAAALRQLFQSGRRDRCRGVGDDDDAWKRRRREAGNDATNRRMEVEANRFWGKEIVGLKKINDRCVEDSLDRQYDKTDGQREGQVYNSL